MRNYFSDFNTLPDNRIIKDMRKFATTNKVPIINDEGLTFMLQIVDLVKPKRFLEIGTAIGFCSINIALYNDEVIIDTIERNEEMYKQANFYINNAKLIDRINVHFADALEFDINNLHNKYDIIFIDAAKAQYIKFFEKYEKLLTDDGVIITDNLLFNGLVANKNAVSNKNLKGLVTKIDMFNNWLSRNKMYRTLFFNIGDGIAISKKVNK